MIKTLIQLARLTNLIIRRGKFHNRRYDYQKMRMEKLADLHQFCPIPPLTDTGRFKKWIFKSHYLGYFSGQAAFLKNALKSQARHLFVPNLNLSYLRNPKAASTSLSYTMLLALYPELKKFELSAEKINFLTDLNLKKEIAAIEKPATFFTVIRNPFARIVSVYRDFFERPSSHFIYEDYLFGILKKDLSFREFVDILQIIPDTLKDQHLKPQNAFLSFYRKRDIEVKFLKLEDQHRVHAFLSDFHLTVPVMNKNETYDYRSYYEPDTLEKVYKLYSQDILLFEYSEDYHDLKKFVSK